MKNPTPLGKRQREVLELMKSGWELGLAEGPSGNVWLQKGGIAKGGETKPVSFDVLISLRNRDLIKVRAKKYPFVYYELTGKNPLPRGKPIELRYHPGTVPRYRLRETAGSTAGAQRRFTMRRGVLNPISYEIFTNYYGGIKTPKLAREYAETEEDPEYKKMFLRLAGELERGVKYESFINEAGRLC